MKYNTGKYDKYTTQNPLKRKMISGFQNKTAVLIKDTADRIRTSRGSEGNAERLRILDAGCGEGFMSRFLYERLDGKADITGLEYTAEAIEIAKKMNSDIEYVRGDITAMPFDNGSFDIVICTEVLEHLEKPAAALSELLRVTSDTLFLSVPHEPWFCLGNLLALKNVSRLGNPIDHINHWTYTGFGKFLNANAKRNWRMDRSFPWTIALCRINENREE